MGATKNNTGGYLKIRGDWENSNTRGHTKFLGGWKNRGGKAFRGPVTEGCVLELEEHKLLLIKLFNILIIKWIQLKASSCYW